MCRGEREKILAVAEADLDREWGGAPEQRSRLERLRGEGDAVLRPQHLESALLCRRDPAAAGHEGADRTRMLGMAHAVMRMLLRLRGASCSRSWYKRARCGSGPRLIGGGAHVELAVSGNHRPGGRSEEHTSELQSHSDLVCRLLLEKKKK